MGQIKYVEAPFSGVDWNKDIHSLFRTEPVMEDDILTQHVNDLKGMAYNIIQDENGDEKPELIFNREEEGRAIEELKCVIIGVRKKG